jgi:hypothetical protein
VAAPRSSNILGNVATEVEEHARKRQIRQPLQFTTSSGALFEIEANDMGRTTTRGRSGFPINSWENALDGVREAIESLVATLRRSSPGEVSIEFGIRVTGESGAIIAKTPEEGNFKIVVSYSSRDSES